MNFSAIRKIIFSAIGLILFILAGNSFYRSRHLKEPVVLSPGVSSVKQLSDYFPAIKGTTNDCHLR